MADRAFGGETVRIRVAADRPGAPVRPIWSWFGYDEPNYTYRPNGRKLLAELAGLHRGPVYVRAHNLLTSGDGTPALKWGSTGAYREGSEGNPVYSWAILDRIFDTYVDLGLTPFVEVGFMPEALSVGPPPYRHDFPRSAITTGWAYPPWDHDRWAGLIEAWTVHMVERYGSEAVALWPFEVWNEPDGLYWRGSVDEFCRLFDVTAAAIRRVLPEARIGGPHTCGPTSERAARFLREFLAHCARGRNHASGSTGTRLDFIAFHAKGKPVVDEGHVRMGLAQQLNDIATGLAIVHEFPEYRDTPVILGESDPEGCAACPASTHPENAYRDGPVYAAYVIAALARTEEIAERAKSFIEGSVTWAFEFEDMPFFAGYRELATNGVAKPVLNAFRMLAMLSGRALPAESSGALPLSAILADGVRNEPDIGAIAARDRDDVRVLVWNYHDEIEPAAGARVELVIEGLPAAGLTCRHQRVDRDHSNAHQTWLTQGSPQPPSPEQYQALLEQSALATIGRSQLVAAEGTVRLDFVLPRHALSLIVLHV